LHDNSREERVVQARGGLIPRAGPTLWQRQQPPGHPRGGFLAPVHCRAIRASQAAVLGGACVILLIGVGVAWFLALNIARPIRAGGQAPGSPFRGIWWTRRAARKARACSRPPASSKPRRTMEAVLSSAQQIGRRLQRSAGQRRTDSDGKSGRGAADQGLNSHAEKGDRDPGRHHAGGGSHRPAGG